MHIFSSYLFKGWVSLAVTERTLRGAAADSMSIHYFAAIPGVAALARLQEALACCMRHMLICVTYG